MNYIKQLNGFWNWRKLNGLSSKQADLYFALLDCANLSYWSSEFSVPNSTLESMCAMSKTELSKHRNELIQDGLIGYKKGKKGINGIYTIVPLYRTNVDTNTDTYMDTYMDTNVGTHMGVDTDANVGNNYKHRDNIDKNEREDEADKPTAGSPRPKIDYNAVVEMYNTICVSLPRLELLTEPRKKTIGARLREFNGDYGKFKAIFEKADASDFLTGQKPATDGRTFTASFDWLLAPKNYPKVLEGNYDNDRYAKPGAVTNNRKPSRFANFDQRKWDFDKIEAANRRYLEDSLASRKEG